MSCCQLQSRIMIVRGYLWHEQSAKNTMGKCKSYPEIWIWTSACTAIENMDSAIILFTEDYSRLYYYLRGIWKRKETSLPETTFLKWYLLVVEGPFLRENDQICALQLKKMQNYGRAILWINLWEKRKLELNFNFYKDILRASSIRQIIIIEYCMGKITE